MGRADSRALIEIRPSTQPSEQPGEVQNHQHRAAITSDFSAPDQPEQDPIPPSPISAHPKVHPTKRILHPQSGARSAQPQRRPKPEGAQHPQRICESMATPNITKCQGKGYETKSWQESTKHHLIKTSEYQAIRDAGAEYQIYGGTY